MQYNDIIASWDWIVSGIDKYVTESMQTKEEKHRASGRLVAKARPRLKPSVTLSSVYILFDRKLITLKHNGRTTGSVIKCLKP